MLDTRTPMKAGRNSKSIKMRLIAWFHYCVSFSAVISSERAAHESGSPMLAAPFCIAMLDIRHAEPDPKRNCLHWECVVATQRFNVSCLLASKLCVAHDSRHRRLCLEACVEQRGEKQPTCVLFACSRFCSLVYSAMATEILTMCAGRPHLLKMHEQLCDSDIFQQLQVRRQSRNVDVLNEKCTSG